MDAKEICKGIILNGSPAEKKELFGFDSKTNHRIIAKKFKLFGRGLFPRYFKQRSAEFHDEFISDMIKSYYGENMLNAAFRGSSKTSLKKLFDVFALLNDRDNYRKYIKVLARDLKNSKQIVTDVFNLMIEAREIYGDVFEKEGDIKREETMMGFTMKNGRKYTAGTVGQTQRGHVQDAYRPDWLWFEDTEDRESIRSMVITQATIGRMAEAIDGLSIDGSFYATCNYISDQGVVQWLMNKPSVHSRITPLLSNSDDDSSATWAIFDAEKVKQIRKDADDFFGEYQCDPAKSENKFFDLDRINHDLKRCRKPDRESAGVRYWGKYLPHHRYGQGSDHSEGIGADANTLAGFDFTDGVLVYTYANNEIAPDLSVHEFCRVGAEFGNCIYAPEVNNKCGGTAITTAKIIGYPNIYRRFDDTKIGVKQTEKLGWDSNSSTRYTMYFEFRKDYNDGLIKIYDQDVLAEMKAYTNNDLNETKAGLITRHFDLLTAVIIAWQMRKHAFVMKNNYKNNYKKYVDSLKA